MSKGLLIIAHGSPRQEANEEFVGLVKKVKAKLPAYQVWHAFLEKYKPTMEEGVDLLISQGVDDLLILPYFLGKGLHTTKDIPAMIESKKKCHPKIRFKSTLPLGSQPEMLELILRLMIDP